MALQGAILPYFKKWVLLTGVVLVLGSCSQGDQEIYATYMAYHSEFKGRSIKFPQDLVMLKGQPKQADYTILKLINTECVSCFQDMVSWNEYIKKNDYIRDQRIVMLASGKANQYFKDEVSRKNYPFEIWLDTTAGFLGENGLARTYQFETFLLDADSTSIMIGSPVKDSDLVEKIYKQIID